MEIPSKLELLAPAGNRECMRAAVANGADAVYFGLRRFSARQRAENFTVEELDEVVGGLHDMNVRAYVAVNTLVFSSELGSAAACIGAIARAGADAIIVQDLGVARLAHEMAPTLPIHASTQMTLSEPWAINEAAARLGVKRVILPRELSLAEIAAVAAATSVELEVFIHGALCVSYSGQCLASLYQGGRSGNRGHCAQPCRLPYGTSADGEASGERRYVMSPRDLSGWRAVGELARAGVRGLKIEGRMKDACYVAATVRLYRRVLDSLGEEELRETASLGASRGAKGAQSASGHAEPRMEFAEDLRAVEQMFSRGAGEGWLRGAKHRTLVEGRTPASTGVRVGVVERSTRRGVVVRMLGGAEIAPGDGLVIRAKGSGLRNAESGFADGDVAGLSGGGEQGGRVWRVEGNNAARQAGSGIGNARGNSGSGAWVEIMFGEGEVDLAKVACGAEVWKTDDPQLRKRLEATFARVAPVRRDRIDVVVHAAAGAVLRAELTDADGRRAEAASDERMEAALRHPLTVGLVREHFERLGDAPLELGDVKLVGPDGVAAAELPVMAPKRVLNEVRRRAVEGLMAARRTASRHEVRNYQLPAAQRRSGDVESAGEPKAPSLSLSVLARSLEQVKAIAAMRKDATGARPAQRGAVQLTSLYVELDDPAQRQAALAACRKAGLDAGLVTPRVLLPGREEQVRRLVEEWPAAVLVRNLGSAAILRAESPHLPLVADFSLNVANELTAGVLEEMGFARVTLSWDLGAEQVISMLKRMDPARAEVIVSARVPMFFTRHCLFAAEGGAVKAAPGPDASASARRGPVDAARGDGLAAGCNQFCKEHRLALRDRKGELLAVAADATCANTVYSPQARGSALSREELAGAGVRHLRVELLNEGEEETRAAVALWTAEADGGSAGQAEG